MKNVFGICFAVLSLIFQTVFAQTSTLVEKMKNEKISLTNTVAKKLPVAQKEWSRVSDQISQLSDNLTVYGNTISPDLEDTSSTDTLAIRKYLLVIQVKNQLLLLSSGVSQMRATLMLENIEGGHGKQIGDLDERISNDSNKFDDFWSQLFEQ